MPRDTRQSAIDAIESYLDSIRKHNSVTDIYAASVWLHAILSIVLVLARHVLGHGFKVERGA